MRFYSSEVLGAPADLFQPSFPSARLLFGRRRERSVLYCFDYTFPRRNLPAGGTVSRRGIRRCAAFLALGLFAIAVGERVSQAQAKPQTPAAAKSKKPRVDPATRKFAERADALLSCDPVSKGQWGLLIVDAQTGQTLFERDADKYFVP